MDDRRDAPDPVLAGRIAIIEQCLAGRLSAPVALGRLLLAAPPGDAVAELERALTAVAVRSDDAPARARLAELRALLGEVRAGCLNVAGLARGDAGRATASPADAVARWADFFDRAVAESEEASVALYSLGSPRILERATAEVVALLERWGVVGPERAVLQVGCGVGRIEALLAPRVREAVGIDVSAGMIEAARRRCAHLPNARFLRTGGRNLRDFGDGAFDLVYAVDAFPYLVEAGMSLVEAHMREARRVLRPGGDVVILNFSYRGDPAADRSDVARLAGAFGFEVLVGGETPFTVWDGVAFHLRRGE
ncbi:MAG TPA: class I SAM-dependent methyltransferase [Longimicrobiales bacterium]|nr:class I SAM-dependent methyltransferase [Longimicrobiales bacterium]